MAGGTPSTKKEEYYDGDIPWITPKDLSGATMRMLDILVPTMNILNRFRDVVEAYDHILRDNYIENDSLIELRDSLLPKLMSGEIRVEDIEANL